jgi:energy-coupling factor transport system permease protein
MDNLSISIAIPHLKMKVNTYVWLAWLAIALLTGILTYNPLYLFALFIALVIIARLHRMNIKKYLISGMMFGLLPLFINTFFVHRGATVLINIPQHLTAFSLKIPLFFLAGPLTLESALFGCVMALLLLDMLLAFGIFSAMVNPDALLRVTPHLFFNSALLASIAMRFTPVISDDMNAVRDAQRSRGLALSKGSLPKRILNHKALIVPTLVSSLERSFNLAESMAVRAYTKNRTNYARESWKARDYLSTAALLCSGFLLILYKINGELTYWPYNLITPTFNLQPIIAIALITIPFLKK